MIRAIGGDDADASRAHFNTVDAAVFPLDIKGVGFLYLIERDGQDQLPILVNIGDAVLRAVPDSRQTKQAERRDEDQKCRDEHGGSPDAFFVFHDIQIKILSAGPEYRLSTYIV